ncbi:HAD-IIIC family phosphatase [bacterium]|nr:HAD-IIIC family phosphatase [bacterium]
MANKIKCLVCDLDNTIWQGTLLEGDELHLRPGVAEVLAELDRRGILLSIASRNDPSDAQRELQRLGIWHYFLLPQINWGNKSESLAAIAKGLNLALDSFAFIDDQPYERAEVTHTHPQVLCLDADSFATLPEQPEFNPEFVTSESAQRRQLYQLDLQRQGAEEDFSGPREDFLRSLNMEFTIHPANREDLQRAFELTVRTHQLNTTGKTYSYEELEAICQSPNYLLLMAELSDRFGPYGKIGLALVELCPEYWHIRLLLMSCRVVGRGVGTILLHRLLEAAFRKGLPVRADFKENGRNAMMLTTYRFAKFRTIQRDDDGMTIMEAQPYGLPPTPDYVRLRGGFAEENYG